MTDKPKLQLPAAYEVGYGKPPAKSRFKKGMSGNLKGRPKGKRNKSKPDVAHQEKLKEIILEEAYRPITVNDGSRQLTVPMVQAVMRSLAVTAAKGSTRAQKIFTELVSATELSQKRADDEWLQTAIQYKAEWESELERRKHFAITCYPEPLPHPDDVVVDYNKNKITVRGPMDKRQQADLDLWLTRRHDNEAELLYLEKQIKLPGYAPYVSQVANEIAHQKRILEIINTALDYRASSNCIARRLSQLDLKTPAYLVKLEAMEESEQDMSQSTENS